MTKRTATLLMAAHALFLSGCISDVDKYFVDKRLNRLAVLRDDLAPGTLIMHANGVAKTGDNILDVAPGATLPLRSFEAVLPSTSTKGLIDAGLALKVLDAVLPAGFEGALKITSNVAISQTTAAGQRVTASQIQSVLAAPEGAPLRNWVLAYAQRKVPTFVVMETYKAKELTITAESGKDVTTDLNINAVKMVDKAGAKFKITRTRKDQLLVSGDKFYVFAVSVAAFDIQKGKVPSIGPLGVDLSLPVPKVPVLGAAPPVPGQAFRPVGLSPEF